MRDSRIGTFGAVGLGFALAPKASALAGLAPGLAAVALVAGHGASRASAMLVVATSAYVHDAGTGRFTAEGLGAAWPRPRRRGGHRRRLLARRGRRSRRHRHGARRPRRRALLARSLFERQIGGYTGDGLGATQQLGEVGFYLGLLAWI